MDTDERDIFQFLKTWGADFTNAKEVARRASSKKRFYEDPDWAKPILMRMTERGILESDVQGRYRIKPVPKKGKNTRWISPDIAKILQEKGLQVEGAAGGSGETGSDEYYDKL